MNDVEDRLAELELRYLRQQDLLEQLSDELVKTNRVLDLTEKRLARLETTVAGLYQSAHEPGQEKPPHY